MSYGLGADSYLIENITQSKQFLIKNIVNVNINVMTDLQILPMPDSSPEESLTMKYAGWTEKVTLTFKLIDTTASGVDLANGTYAGHNVFTIGQQVNYLLTYFTSASSTDVIALLSNDSGESEYIRTSGTISEISISYNGGEAYTWADCVITYYSGQVT